MEFSSAAVSLASVRKATGRWLGGSYSSSTRYGAEPKEARRATFTVGLAVIRKGAMAPSSRRVLALPGRDHALMILGKPLVRPGTP